MWMSECSFSSLLLLRCCLLSTSLLCRRPRQAPRTFPCTPSYLRWSPWCYFLSCVFSSHACSATGEWEPSNGEPRSPSPGQEMYNKAMQRWRKRYYRFLSFFFYTKLFIRHVPKKCFCFLYCRKSSSRPLISVFTTDSSSDQHQNAKKNSFGSSTASLVHAQHSGSSAKLIPYEDTGGTATIHVG